MINAGFFVGGTSFPRTKRQVAWTSQILNGKQALQ